MPLTATMQAVGAFSFADVRKTVLWKGKCFPNEVLRDNGQFSKKDFEHLQNTLDRPIGQWNCKHITFPILLGISQPAYTDEELAAFARNSREEITIDGVTMTRYEWTQKQRQIETAVRAQKNIAIMAKAAGDDLARREAQRNINALEGQYARITDAAGLTAKKERMRVAGFRAVKTVEALKNKPKNGIIQVAGQPVNVRMKAQKQREHIWGSAEFVRRTENAKAANKNLPSAFYQDLDVEELVKKHIGTGNADVNKSGTISEYFDAGKNIGWVYGPASGAYMTTSRVCIRYSKNGWHAFPVLPKE